MKYILKYNVKSKYFHFTRELQKEYDDAVELYTFIRENNIKNYTLYKEINDALNDKRIIKALEYINKWKSDNYNYAMNFEDEKMYPFDLQKLLKILNGGKNEKGNTR